MAIVVLPLFFLQLGLPCRSSLLSAIFNSSRRFYSHAVFIAAVYFIAVQPDINFRGFSFKAGPFLCLVAFFFAFLFFFCCFVVVILVIFTPSFFVAVPIVTIQPIAIHIL